MTEEERREAERRSIMKMTGIEEKKEEKKPAKKEPKKQEKGEK